MNMRCYFPWKEPWPYAVYIAMTFFSFGWMNYSLGHQDLVYTKICYQSLQNVTLTQCENKRYTRHRFQADAADWLNYMTVLEKVPALLVIVLMSSYTDKVGHKLPMIMASSGYLLALVWFAINAHFVDWPIEALLGASVVLGFSGSFAVMSMSCVGYVSLARPENRAFHISLYYSTFQLGKFIGTLVQGEIGQPRFSRLTFFAVSAGAMGVALLVICIILVDIKKPGHESVKVRDIVGFSTLLESTMCVFKKREGRKTLLLQLSLIIFFMMLCSSVFEFSTEYLYLTKELHLPLSDYSHIKATINVLRIVVPPVMIPILQRVLKLHNFTIMITAMAFIGGEMILLGQGRIILIWVSAVVGSPHSIFSSMMQGYQVDLIGRAEVGKMLSYTAFFQTIIDLVGQVGSKSIYKTSLNINFPGLVYLLACMVVLIAMILTIVLDRLNSQEIEHHRSPESDVSPIIDPDDMETNSIQCQDSVGKNSGGCAEAICLKKGS